MNFQLKSGTYASLRNHLAVACSRIVASVGFVFTNSTVALVKESTTFVKNSSLSTGLNTAGFTVETEIFP